MARLRRMSDGKCEQGARSEAILWNEDGDFSKVVSNRPTVHCAMLVGSITARSYSEHDYWLTSLVTEILEDTGDYVKFKTENSIYEWWA